ncbi:hypothetical protein M9H77_31250 [Catharanthus roseus]|uniref:Uncharacterized protein n=1 Tax=Catharanthus roseus TaxID=4058 RepID=A0ACC0A1W0_CATRO|nr:hypothetical protein M9H77_31250 [Catharanthus roseus]
MEAINPVRVMLFWDSEIARDAYDGDDAISSQFASDDDNDREKGEFQTPLNPVNPVDPVTENIVQQWESSQWFSNARYDYTHSGAFLDIGLGSPINDLVESGTVRLVDGNDSMTDIQLGMRFVDKAQAVSAVRCTYKRVWYARKFAIERVFVAGIQPSVFYLNTYKLYRI